MTPDCFGNFPDVGFDEPVLSEDECITCGEHVGEHHLTRKGQCEECSPDCVDCGKKAHEDSEDGERCAACELKAWREYLTDMPKSMHRLNCKRQIAVWEAVVNAA